MLVNVTTELLDLDGNTMPVQTQTRQLAQEVLSLLAQDRVQDVRASCEAVAAAEPLTLRKAACDALGAQFEDEKDLLGTDKVKRMDLALRLMAKDEVILAAEDIVLLKTVVNKGFRSPLVVGRAYAVLEGTDAQPDDEPDDEPEPE